MNRRILFLLALSALLFYSASANAIPAQYRGKTRVCFEPKNAVFPSNSLCRLVEETFPLQEAKRKYIYCPSVTTCNNGSGDNCSFWFRGYTPMDLTQSGTQKISGAYSSMVWMSEAEGISGYTPLDVSAWVVLDQNYWPNNNWDQYEGGTVSSQSWESAATSLSATTGVTRISNFFLTSLAPITLKGTNGTTCTAPTVDCRGRPLFVRISKFYDINAADTGVYIKKVCLEGE